MARPRALDPCTPLLIDRRREALRAGRLKEAFAEEIKKSWEEYTVQVGRDLAESTPFFTEALNEILAEGQPVF